MAAMQEIERLRRKLETLEDKTFADVSFTQDTKDGKRKALLKRDLLPEQITSFELMPPKVSETLQRVRELGFKDFDCYHIPPDIMFSHGFKPHTPDQVYYATGFRIVDINFSKDAHKHTDTFILFDRRQRMDFEDVLEGKTDENDPLGPLLERLRKEKKIDPDLETSVPVPGASRCGASVEEVYGVVFPEMRKIFGLENVEKREVKMRMPTLAEFIIFGKYVYPYLNQATTWEWVEHKLSGSESDLIPDHFLIAGSSAYNKGDRLNFVSSRPIDRHSDNVAFRPVIVFSSKTE